MTNFKDRFKELRKEKDLGQKEIGISLGYSESTISLYESGKREPKTAEDFIKIADFFGVTLDYLMGISDERKNTIAKSALTPKDEKDIEKATEKFLDGLEGGAMLNGEILDEEDMELFKQAVKNGLTYAKISNKKKYTPKKYRKNND